MSSIDLKNDISNESAFAPVVIASDTTTAGAIIDTSGFESCTFLNRVSAFTDGTYTPLIEDGDDAGLSDAAPVADDFLSGTEAALVAAGDSSIGYVGKKRYVRISFVSASTSTGATVDSVAVLGSPRHAAV